MKLCPHCQGQNRDVSRFCGHCGQSLSSAPAPPEPPRKRGWWKTFAILVLVMLAIGRILDFVLYSDARGKLEERGIPFNEQQFLQEVQDGNTEVVELFLRAGIEYEASGFHLYILNEALDDAIKNGRADLVKLLLTHGANPNPEGLERSVRFLPLSRAAEKGDMSIVRALLESGAYVNAKDYGGMTALERAIRNSHTEVAQLLKEAGAE